MYEGEETLGERNKNIFHLLSQHGGEGFGVQCQALGKIVRALERLRWMRLDFFGCARFFGEEIEGFLASDRVGTMWKVKHNLNNFEKVYNFEEFIKKNT